MLYVWNVAITVKFFLTLYDGKMSEEKNVSGKTDLWPIL